MASSENELVYEEQKKKVIQQKSENKVIPADVYKLARLLARWNVSGTLPVCLLCQAKDADESKKVTQLGHIFPYSILKEAGQEDCCFDFIRGASFGASKMGYHAFCPDCEVRFQQGEVHLNPKLFKPFYHNTSAKIEVKVLTEKENFPWLYYCCISIVWRCLCFIPHNDEFLEMLECLRQYLLDRSNSESMDKCVKLLIFAPNKKVDGYLNSNPGISQDFFYKMFTAHFDTKGSPLAGPEGRMGWIVCGPLHICMLYKDHYPFLDSCKLTREMKRFTIDERSKRCFPDFMIQQIVYWGNEALSATSRLKPKTEASSSLKDVEGTHLHLLPKDVSYDRTSGDFLFISKIYKQKFTEMKLRGKIVGITQGNNRNIFIVLEKALLNGGEIAMGLKVNDDYTVTYMQGVQIDPRHGVGVDLTNPPFKELIENLIRDIPKEKWS